MKVLEPESCVFHVKHKKKKKKKWISRSIVYLFIKKKKRAYVLRVKSIKHKL